MKVRSSLKLAWNNLFRHGKRTIITASAIAVGLAIFIFTDSMLKGLDAETEKNLILYETGAAQVLADGYLVERDLRPLRYAIDDVDEIETLLEKSGIRATARTVFNGELIVFQDPFPEDGSIQVTAYGIDPADDGDVYRLEETLSDGRFLEPGEDGVILGGWLAEDIDAKVGYPVTIVTRTRQGYFQTLELEVVGIVTTPNPIVNRHAVFIPIDIADFYLQMDGGVTEIAVAGGLKGFTADLQEQMTANLAGISGISVVGWKQLAMDYVNLAETKKSGSSMILFLVFIIAVVGVSNTVLMSVMERTREIGMMRAMGMYDGEIRRLLLTEAAGIGVIGGALGVLFGGIANFFLVKNGLDFTFMLRDLDAGYRVAGVMYGIWDPVTFLTALGTAVIVTIFTAMVPVRRALKITIVDGLRSN